MKPEFEPGKNIAMKVPPHQYDETVKFYAEVLGLTKLSGDAPSSTESVRFEFGGKVLWIDKVPSLSQAEIWLEVVATDVDAAARYLKDHGCIRRDEIEALPDDFKGFWISSPSNIIHLIAGSHDT